MKSGLKVVIVNMKYPIAIEKEASSDYGVNVPDIPGCFSAGATMDEAIENAKEAIFSHCELLAEDGELAPLSKTVEYHQNNEAYSGMTWVIVELDLSCLDIKTEKVNVTLPSFLIHKIDNVVKSSGFKSRSAFLSEAAWKHLDSL